MFANTLWTARRYHSICMLGLEVVASLAIIVVIDSHGKFPLPSLNRACYHILWYIHTQRDYTAWLVAEHLITPLPLQTSCLCRKPQIGVLNFHCHFYPGWGCSPVYSRPFILIVDNFCNLRLLVCWQGITAVSSCRQLTTDVSCHCSCLCESQNYTGI